MTRAAAIVLVLALAPVSCVGAATLTVRATMPTRGDVGVCGAPIVRDTLYSPMWLHVRWVGPVGARPELVGRDSLLSWPGAEALWRRTDLAAGVYRMSVWASNRAGAGCDTSYADTALTRPAAVTLKP